VAIAKGNAPDWEGLGKPDGPGEVTLRLAKDDVPIKGRVVDLEGRPVAGARILVGAVAKRADGGDLKTWIALLKATVPRLRPDAALADAGYDSEPNHRYDRQQSIRSFIPATAGRPTTKPLRGRYRRQMKQRLDKHYGKYGQRAQVETSFSMIKRLGPVVRGWHRHPSIPPRELPPGVLSSR
jgi:hypothetical protein